MRTASLGMSNDRENVMKLKAGHSTLCKYGSSQNNQDNLKLVKNNIRHLYREASRKSESLASLPLTDTLRAFDEDLMNDCDKAMWRRKVFANYNSMATSGDEHGRPARSTSLQPGKPQPLFYKYLRVLHDFGPSIDPSTNTDENSITVLIEQGDLILVHSIHENGWADGTLFSSDIRGWVPTNYCEVYDHPYIRNLLNGTTQFWGLLEDSEAASLQIFIRQDYIRGLIAGVRCLLEHASCLHRNATLVQQNVGIRRTRKGLLADLYSMVSKAKELQEEAGQPYDKKIIHTMLDELITKASRVVTRAVRFADAWTLEAMTRPRSDCSAKPDAALLAPLNLYYCR